MPCPNHPQVYEPLAACARCSNAFCADCLVPLGGLPYCASCKAEVVEDLAAGVPSGAFELASISSRLVALILDYLVVSLPAVAVALVLAISFGVFDFQKPNPNAILLQLFVTGLSFFQIGAWILYEGLMLSVRGQTLGKRAVRIKVVGAGGGPITRGQAFGRAGIRQLISMFCFIVDYALVFGRERTCIHDMLARTRVVKWPYE